MIKPCERCGKDILTYPSVLAKGRDKYCSRACSDVGKLQLNCAICNNQFTTHQCKIDVGRGKYCSRVCYEVSKKTSFTAESNPKWKGNKVGYRALHSWVTRRLGRPNKCEHCKTTSKREYEWANISKKYLRDTKDWVRLCVPCHKIFDR